LKEKIMRRFKLITGLAVAAVLAISGAGIVNVKANCGSCGESHNHAEHAHSIYTTAKEGGFKTLSAAIDAAGLQEALSGKGPFTVFAPTDEAFAKLPEGTVEALLKDPEALKNILLYHVVSGEVKAADVVKIKSAEMLNGQSVEISSKKGVKINDSNVIKTDILAENGVIHVIDTVLIPPKKS
jgi:uncharacterized surface protein with fasciclin (FAS1) repeats